MNKIENKKEEEITEEEIARQIAYEKSHADTPMEIDMIKNQWIPDTEKVIAEIPSGEKKKGFSDELEKIKSAVVFFETADFGDESVVEQARELYERAEKLFADASDEGMD